MDGGTDQEKAADMVGEAEERKQCRDDRVQPSSNLHRVLVAEGKSDIPQVGKANAKEQDESDPMSHLDTNAEYVGDLDGWHTGDRYTKEGTMRFYWRHNAPWWENGNRNFHHLA